MLALSGLGASLLGCGGGETGILVAVRGAGVTQLEFHIGRDDAGKWRQEPGLKQLSAPLSRDISSRPFNLLVVPGAAGLDQTLAVDVVGFAGDKPVARGSAPGRGAPGLRFADGQVIGVDIDLTPFAAPGPFATADGCFCADGLPSMTVGGAPPACDPLIPGAPDPSPGPVQVCDGYLSAAEASAARLVPCFARTGDVCRAGTRTCADEARVAFEAGCAVTDASPAAEKGTFCGGYAAASQPCADPMVGLWKGAPEQPLAIDPCDPTAVLPGQLAVLPFGFDLAGVRDAVYLEGPSGEHALAAAAPIRLRFGPGQLPQTGMLAVPLLIDDHKVLLQVSPLGGCPGSDMGTVADMSIRPDGVIGVVDGASPLDLSLTRDMALPGVNFQPGLTYPSLGGLNSIVLADLNGDQNLDAVLGSVLGCGYQAGSANGALQGPGMTLQQGQYTAVAVGHFDNDPTPDIATVDLQSSKLVVLANRGGFAFQGIFSTTLNGVSPAFVATGDFDGNNLPDIAVANGGNAGAASGASLLNLGNGGFANTLSIDGAVNPASVAVADFNGDGKLDLAFGQPGQQISVFNGDGKGAFALGGNIPGLAGPQYVVAADFNRDGLPDLAAANRSNGTLQILINLGGNTGFKAFAKYTVGQVPWGLAVADLNGDQLLDIAVSNDQSKDVTIVRGHGDGSFDVLAAPLLVGAQPHPIAIGDLDRNGRPDIVVGTQNSLVVFLQK